jgi:hypothetical protein
VWVLVDEQGAAFVLDDGHDAVKAALKFPMDRRPTVHRYTLATPPAVSEPFEKIEELPAVLRRQNSAAQTEQDTEAVVWVDAETMGDLARFAIEVLKQWHGDGERGDIEGAWIQETAQRIGVALTEERLTPCGEVCPCRDFAGSNEVVPCAPIRDDVFALMQNLAALRGATETGEGAHG